MNVLLTARAHQTNSHKDKGWEQFTDEVIRAVGEKTDPVVSLLWGAYAQKKIDLIDTTRQIILKAPHPSPLSAKRGLFGSRPFSQVNTALRAAKCSEIHWQIPDL